MFIWQIFLPADRDPGWKNQDVGNRGASPPSYENISKMLGDFEESDISDNGPTSSKNRKKERLSLVVVVFFSLLESGWLCDLTPKRAGCLKRKVSLQFT